MGPLNRSDARGLTLIELLICIVLLGILLLLMAPVLGEYITSSANNYFEQAKVDNQRVADALAAVAKNEGAGALPAPYAGGGYSSAVVNPTDASAIGLAFRQALAETGIAPAMVNEDGTASRNARVYQRLSGLTQVMPLYFRSGPSVVVTYDYGVVYLTGCPLTSGSCGLGASPGITAANRGTWNVVQPDIAPAFVSSLPAQTAMLATTSRRLDRVRDALLSYYRSKQLTAAATDVTNWFPGSGMAGKAPSSNQGCRDGWYALDTTTVLQQVGLAPSEFGSTSWGGRIEYCRDYDPTAAKAADAPPHAAALRFRASVSLGASPDPSTLSNNVILTL